MAYKRYIKREGKLYGPYIYHNIRKGGKIISEYRGKVSKDRNLIFLIVGLSLLFLLIFISIFNPFSNLNLFGLIVEDGQNDIETTESEGIASIRFVIEIINAWRLDEDREVISNIYPEVSALDDIWSETINDGDYIRVTFERNLTSDRDITIYPRTITGSPRVEIYEVGSNSVIAEFTNINSNEYNKIFLTNLQGTQDVFDLLILEGSLEFDHIVDPTNITTCQTISSAGIYILQNDISINGSTCFTITANDVILDGNGFTIDGNDSSGTRGVLVNGPTSNVTVKNFKNITDFQRNVQTQSSSNTLILNNTISSASQYNIYLFSTSSNNSVINNTVIGDGGTSHEIIVASDYNVIKNNFIRVSTSFGVLIDSGGFENLIENNTIEKGLAGIAGIKIDLDEENNTLLNNNISGFTTLIQDFSGASRLNYLIYNNSFGEIKWIDNGTGSFLRDLDLVGGDIALGTNVEIGNSTAYVNASAFSSGLINSAANITLYGMDSFNFTNPAILKDASVCALSECYNFTPLNASTVVFNVTNVGANYTIENYTDIISPNVTLVSPIDNGNASGSPQFTFNATDTSPFKNATVYINISGTWQKNETNQTTISGVNTKINVTGLTTGGYIWNVYVCDTYHNCGFSSNNYTVNIDASIPNVTLLSPATNQVLNDTNTLTINLSVSDIDEIISCSLHIDNSTQVLTADYLYDINQSLNHSLSFTLEPGSYSWYGNCTDYFGNSNITTTYNLTINDAGTPNITSVTGDNLTQWGNLTITGLNFSFKANEKPLLYWRADLGTSNASVPTFYGRNTSWDGSFLGSNTTDIVATGSNSSIRFNHDETSGASLARVNFESDRFYMSRKLYNNFTYFDAISLRTRYTNTTEVTLDVGHVIRGFTSGETGIIRKGTNYSFSEIFYERGNGSIDNGTQGSFTNGEIMQYFWFNDTNFTTPIYNVTNNEGVGLLRDFNNKILRSWATEASPISGNKNNILIGLTDGGSIGSQLVTPEYTDGSFYGGSWDNIIYHNAFNWSIQEFIYQTSSLDVGDGTFNFIENGIRGWHTKKFINRDFEEPFKYTHLFQHQVSNGADPVASRYYDYLYIDDSWHRAFISNSSTYNESSNVTVEKEIQIPQTWNDTSITIAFNAGSLNTSENLYMYVVNKDGNYNLNGFLINLSSSGGANTTLTISDLSDSQTVYANYSSFTANYTNSSASPITGSDVSCTWTQNKTGVWKQYDYLNLAYNSSSSLYELIVNGKYLTGYAETIPVGTYFYNVTCSNTQGYSNLTVVDQIVVNDYNTSLIITNSSTEIIETVETFFYANYTSDWFNVTVDFSEINRSGFNSPRIGQIIWMNNSIGGFSGTNTISFADLNNDGSRNDIVVPHKGQFSTQSAVTGFYNNGTYYFTSDIANLGTTMGQVKAFDGDNDSYFDEIVHASQTDIIVYNSSGTILFNPVISTSSVYIVAVGDLDGDGLKDDFVHGFRRSGDNEKIVKKIIKLM